MRAKALLLGIGAVAIAAGTYVHTMGHRGITIISDPSQSAGAFDRLQSAGLFVGVRRFETGGAIEVPYAVDDAVDLAYMFTLDRRASLLPARRVILALSGHPQKPESKDRLRRLKNAGAVVKTATSEDILRLLAQQAAAVGKDGILLFSLATHGFIDQDEHQSYVLGSNSLFEHRRTALRLEGLIDMAAASNARRSLLFIDACRDRYRTGTRGAGPDPSSIAPAIVNRMSRIHGQVVFYAAPAGKYAYDDERRRNGVFTGAVIDGLSCEATAVDGIITAEKLHEYVNRAVLKWVRKHREKDRSTGIQLNVDGRTDNMPLSVCTCPPCPPLGPTRVTARGSKITALDAEGKAMWTRDLGEPVTSAEVSDLNADGARDVVVHAGGKVVTFDAQGQQSWQTGPTIRRLLVGVLRKYKPEVVAQTGEKQLAIFDGGGKVMWSFDVPDSITDFKIGRASKQSDWRLVVASANQLSLFNPNLGTRIVRTTPGTIESIDFRDGNGDGKLDIAVRVKSGRTTFYDFKGKSLS